MQVNKILAQAFIKYPIKYVCKVFGLTLHTHQLGSEQGKKSVASQTQTRK